MATIQTFKKQNLLTMAAKNFVARTDYAQRTDIIVSREVPHGKSTKKSYYRVIVQEIPMEADPATMSLGL